MILFHKYLCYYGDYNVDPLPFSSMNYFLRFWEKNKAGLFRLFGEKLILSKEINFEKNKEQLESEMYYALYNNTLIYQFMSNFGKYVDALELSIQVRCSLKQLIGNQCLLVGNVWTGETFTIPKEFTTDGKPFVVSHGCKIAKIVDKVCKAIGFNDPEGYEEWRIAQSMVLNQKRTRGTLCLSIHPFDYITMSDNECDWSSCMSWMEEPGDYRLGTIEMMNSPYVVVAYVKSKSDMEVPGGEWNNKKWRQLFIVHPDIILGNRQYPYSSDELQGICLNWLRELASRTVGYGPYASTSSLISNGRDQYISEVEKQIFIRFSANFMYNDVQHNKCLAYVNPNIQLCFMLNFSGEPVCIGCGEIIEYDSVDASQVICRECDGSFKCSYCGEWHRGEQYWVDDEVYCRCCYEYELQDCECCGDRMTHDSGHKIYIHIQGEEELFDEINSSIYIRLCDWCYNNPEYHMKYFGPIYWMAGGKRVFLLENITNEGLERGDLSETSIEFLKRIRDAKSDKEKANIIREMLLA